MDKKAKKRVMDSLSTVRLVARLSERCWSKAEEIFRLYEEGAIKGQRKTKNQLGLPDCKKSNWQFLHGLSEDQQFSLLSKIADKSLTFAEVEANAKEMKAEEKVCTHHCI